MSARAELPEHRLRRLRLRSMRRGIKEMDLILTSYADAQMGGLNGDDLALYERLLDENDHDIYAWISGTLGVPEHYRDMIDRIARNFQARSFSA